MAEEATLRLLCAITERSEQSTCDHSVSDQKAASKANAEAFPEADNTPFHEAAHQVRFIPAYSRDHYSQQPLPEEPVFLVVSQNPNMQGKFREEMETTEPVFQAVTSVSTPVVSETDSNQNPTCGSPRKAWKRVEKGLGSILKPFESGQKTNRKKEKKLRGYQKLN